MGETRKSVPPWMWLWAKTDATGANKAAGGPAWTPLLAHFLDVAAAAGQLWDRYLTPVTRTLLAADFGAGDEESARRVVMLLTALHDFGKASVSFQRQFATSRWSSNYLRAARPVWERQARAAGLPLPTDLDVVPYARHEHVTALHLPRILGCTCHRCGGNGPQLEGLHSAALLLGGHHGHFPNLDTVSRAAAAAPIAMWEPLYREMVTACADLIGQPLAALPDLVHPRRPAALIAFSGLVILADWIASDQESFPFRTPLEDPADWWRHAQVQAIGAISALRLDRWNPKPATWQQLWPGTSPRPFQQAVIDALPAQGPALIIIESDTGSGKTRLALYCALHLARTCGYQGLYMAMPTRAATNEIARELKDFADKAGGGQVNLALVHGTASATNLVHELLDAPHNQECENPEHAVLDPWYLERCRGLISALGIGTVDQIVLAPQGSRHWMLRMFALSGKTVIIDEAHAYELFQQDLLAAAVQWLADAGASVIVLSATLPASARQSLERAWCAGHHAPTREDGSTGPIAILDRHGTVRRIAPTTPPPELATTIDFLPAINPTRPAPAPKPEELAARLLTQAAHGGIIAVVRNRVASAIDLHAAALELAHEHGWSQDEIILLHGRLLPRDRQPLEELLTRLCGPNPQDRSLRNPNRATRLLVIATQVIEQSLDLDFDRLYTDLAPIDLLIQRRGRVHRHAVNDPGRPAWCTEPAITILWQPDQNAIPLVMPPDPRNRRYTGNKDGFIYAPYALAATWHTLATRADTHGTIRISTPRDSTSLIEYVYGPDCIEVAGRLGRVLAETWDAWRQSLADEAEHANERAFRPYSERRHTPVDVEALASGIAHGDGDHGGMQGVRAISRLGESSETAIALYQQTGATADATALTYDPEGRLPADLKDHHRQRTPQETAAYRQQQRDLLLNTIAIPQSWFRGRTALPEPDTWPELTHPPLRRANVILLNPVGACTSGPRGLRYHPITGLAK